MPCGCVSAINNWCGQLRYIHPVEFEMVDNLVLAPWEHYSFPEHVFFFSCGHGKTTGETRALPAQRSVGNNILIS
jgi:hypothetical protein